MKTVLAKRCLVLAVLVGFCGLSAPAQNGDVASVKKQPSTRPAALSGEIETARARGLIADLVPVVRRTPSETLQVPGLDPPASEAIVIVGSMFHIELWATNSDVPLDGLACVYVDLSFDNTVLVDLVPPAQDSPLFPINAVSAVFDDAAGTVGDVGACQPAPATSSLGVDEWVMVKRIDMSAVTMGGPITVTLQDADNLFAGVSIISHSNNLDPVDISFQSRQFLVGCAGPGDCDDQNICTEDTCADGVCGNDPIPGCCLTDEDCTGGMECDLEDDTCRYCVAPPPGMCCNPLDGTLIPIDDEIECTDDICNPDGSVDHNDNCPEGQVCDLLAGICKADCQPNGVPDDRDIAEGTSEDSNDNGVPDECEVWPPAPEPGGPPCLEDTDCLGDWLGATCVDGTCYVPKNRHLSIDPTTNALPVAYQLMLTISDPYPTAVGITRWVEAPVCYDYPNGDPVLPPPATCDEGPDRFGWVAHLTLTPVTRVWTEVPLHITDCLTVPVTTYEIRATKDEGANFSEPLEINTIHVPDPPQHWGDTVGGPGTGGMWLPPNRAMNMADVQAAIRTFENETADTGFPPRVWIDVEINQVINMADVQFLIMGFEALPYAEIQDLDFIGWHPADCP